MLQPVSVLNFLFPVPGACSPGFYCTGASASPEPQANASQLLCFCQRLPQLSQSEYNICCHGHNSTCTQPSPGIPQANLIAMGNANVTTVKHLVNKYVHTTPWPCHSVIVIGSAKVTTVKHLVNKYVHTTLGHVTVDAAQ